MTADDEAQTYYRGDAELPKQSSQSVRRVRRKGRRYTFRMVGDHVLWHPDLKPPELVFYMRLLWMAGEEGETTYSVPFMAALCRVSVRSIQNYEKKLEKLGLIERDFRTHPDDPRRNDNNLVTVLDEPEQEPDYPFRRRDLIEAAKGKLKAAREAKRERRKESR